MLEFFDDKEKVDKYLTIIGWTSIILCISFTLIVTWWWAIFGLSEQIGFATGITSAILFFISLGTFAFKDLH